MSAFQKTEKRAWGLGGKESDIAGSTVVKSPVFAEFLSFAESVINSLNPIELTDIKGRESGESLIQDLGVSSQIGEHELFFVRASYFNPEDKTTSKITRSVTTPFLRFEDQSIVQSYTYNGGGNRTEVLQLDGLAIETVRFGIEFFGASNFAKFVNFAPSVVATIHAELNEKEFALRIWREDNRKIYKQSQFDATLRGLSEFCRSALGETLPI